MSCYIDNIYADSDISGCSNSINKGTSCKVLQLFLVWIKQMRFMSWNLFIWPPSVHLLFLGEITTLLNLRRRFRWYLVFSVLFVSLAALWLKRVQRKAFCCIDRGGGGGRGGGAFVHAEVIFGSLCCYGNVFSCPCSCVTRTLSLLHQLQISTCLCCYQVWGVCGGDSMYCTVSQPQFMCCCGGQKNTLKSTD